MERQEASLQPVLWVLLFNFVDLKCTTCESCEFSFIWGKTRTAARETALQRALRNCSREAAGKVRIGVILVKGEYTQSSTYFFAAGFC